MTLEELGKLRSNNPNPMFKNGVFNPDNWNGGDDLIRNWIAKIFYEVDALPSIGWSMFECRSGSWATGLTHGDSNTIALVATLTFYDDQSYLFFCHEWSDERNEEKENFDIYFFSWYKNRGRTDVATFNGQPMTEEQYCKLLTMLGY